jgi:phospholipase C
VKVPKLLVVPLLFVASLIMACARGLLFPVNTGPTVVPTDQKGTTVINHVIIMLQQNHSFDNYFGQMTAYRQRNGIPIVSSDGKINDLSTGNYSNTVVQAGVIPVAKTGSVCTEDLSSDWNESHKEMDLSNPSAAGTNSPMDGFAQTAYDVGQYALTFGVTLTDQTGRRAMHYHDDTDLNYYYFMASNFAISDAFFTPMPSRFLNRIYLNGATSQGYVHDPGTQLTAKTIWQSLDAAGVSWKIYIPDKPPVTYLQYFTYFNLESTKAHIVPLDQYFTDLQNGTLPSVAVIEPALFTGRDEHPSNFDPATRQVSATSVQAGAQFVSTLINGLMNSSSWKDSVFFLSYDEGGGFFDHVPPISVPSPDGIPPRDLIPGDPTGDFTTTGFRVANMVISPFARKNYVSHTPMDQTAYLKFIETRWLLPNLNARDLSMPDMTEFFDFAGAPWATPPTPPPQNTNGACDFSLQ